MHAWDTAEIDDIKLIIRRKKDQLQDISKTLTRCDDDIKLEEAKLSRLKTEIKHTQQQTDGEENNVNTLEIEKAVLKQELERLYEEEQSADKQHLQARTKKTNLNTQLISKRNDLVSIKARVNWFVNHYTYDYPSGVCDNPDHPKEYKAVQQKQNQLIREVSNLENDVAMAENEIQSAKQSLEHIRRGIQEKWRQIEEKNREISASNSKISSLKNEIQAKENKMDSIESNKSMYEAENRRLKSRQDYLQEELQESELKLKRLMEESIKKSKEEPQKPSRYPGLFHERGLESPIHSLPSQPTHHMADVTAFESAQPSIEQQASRNYLEEAAQNLLNSATNRIMNGMINRYAPNEAARQNIRAFDNIRKKKLEPLIDDIGEQIDSYKKGL